VAKGYTPEHPMVLSQLAIGRGFNILDHLARDVLKPPAHHLDPDLVKDIIGLMEEVWRDSR